MLIFSKVIITEEIFSLFTTLLIDFNNEFKDTNEVLTFSNLSFEVINKFFIFYHVSSEFIGSSKLFAESKILTENAKPCSIEGVILSTPFCISDK